MSGSPMLDGVPKANGNGPIYPDHKIGGSIISLGPSDGEEPSFVHSTTIEAIVWIAWTCKVEKIIALAASMLIQKIGRISLEVDAKIITETAILAVHSAPSDLRALLKLYSRLCHDNLAKNNTLILDAVLRARLHLSQGIKRGSENFEIYTVHLLDSIVSQGDAHEGENKHDADVELATKEIAQLLQPLAVFGLANATGDTEEDLEIEGFANLQRDAWFNAVVHGFTLSSRLGTKYRKELQNLARFSQPLVPEDRTDQLESDIEFNTTLRRGKSSEHTADHKKHLIEVLPSCESDIRVLTYSETVFLTAAYLVENLRASDGDCTKVLTYFLDPRLRSGAMGKCMQAIAMGAVKTYLSRTLAGKAHAFSSPYVAQQLAIFFSGCCHRIDKVQQVARSCADLIISQVPSSLCHRSSLFALLELLTIMWNGCLEQETDEYEWTPTFKSTRGNVEVELSDDFSFRRATLTSLKKCAKSWMQFVIDIAPLDIKGLIQTYLSEFDDEVEYGHVLLGRSFAQEMGGAIPTTDPRLGALETQLGLSFNTASDFVAQYTTRQEYRFVGASRDDDQEWVRSGVEGPFERSFDKSIQYANALLSDMEARTLNKQQVAIAELRDVLRRAGALLCRSTDKDQGAMVHHLVGIPFAVFTKQSIKLGISLWMGVIKENARMESRMLVEIAENWENTVRNGRGLFDKRLQ
jgi:phosphatidylinositol 4-kinase